MLDRPSTDFGYTGGLLGSPKPVLTKGREESLAGVRAVPVTLEFCPKSPDTREEGSKVT